MDGAIFQVAIWAAAGGVLFVYLKRRRKRRAEL